MSAEAAGFSVEQQEYLKGFMTGVEARRAAFGLPPGPPGGGAADPNDLQRAAQDRAEAGGGKLVAEEQAKRNKPPLGRFDEVTALAGAGQFPKGTDVFLTKYFGLFYVAPAQNAFMCRLRIVGGIITAAQLRGVAQIADDLAGGYADITTRANLQLREIGADGPPEVLMRLAEIGLTSRGSGADNIRNITGSPTAGIDPEELLDTRPAARALHHFILHHPELYGLPRKFNIAFDGGGRVAVLQDTNDIGFTAVRVAEGFGVPAGVYWRLDLGGITGHRDFARDTGVLVDADATIPVANAVLRVFIAEGDRTDRHKARLKYVLDRLGLEGFLGRVEAELGEKLCRVDASSIQPAPAQDRLGHIGVHPQKQPGLRYIGVVFPVGRISTERMRGLAAIAERFGSAELRLTVWQNLLIPNVAEADVPAAVAAIEALGLSTSASPLRAGLVACTGNVGCKFAASDTKRHASALVDYLEARLALDSPINIHLTGCPNSCAQHYIADIGLLAAKVEPGGDEHEGDRADGDQDEEMIEGYDLHVGGGAGPHQAIGRLIRPGVAFDDLPPMVAALLGAWMATRVAGEGFQDWSAARGDDELRAIGENLQAEAA
ncbi:NirA family protein [Rhodopila sp.]|uniref:NirA family protein n=1 Tax=Rhodopila sp. TaxID=2480087 RepID=UPI003D0C92FF